MQQPARGPSHWPTATHTHTHTHTHTWSRANSGPTCAAIPKHYVDRGSDEEAISNDQKNTAPFGLLPHCAPAPKYGPKIVRATSFAEREERWRNTTDKSKKKEKKKNTALVRPLSFSGSFR